MTYRGTVRKDGAVILERSTKLPAGTIVSVRPTTPRKGFATKQQPSIFEQIVPFVGKAKSLPRDIAENHDHYLYGTAKRR